MDSWVVALSSNSKRGAGNSITLGGSRGCSNLLSIVVDIDLTLGIESVDLAFTSSVLRDVKVGRSGGHSHKSEEDSSSEFHLDELIVLRTSETDALTTVQQLYIASHAVAGCPYCLSTSDQHDPKANH
jgi:hypothetical protein